MAATTVRGGADAQKAVERISRRTGQMKHPVERRAAGRGAPEFPSGLRTCARSTVGISGADRFHQARFRAYQSMVALMPRSKSTPGEKPFSS